MSALTDILAKGAPTVAKMLGGPLAGDAVTLLEKAFGVTGTDAVQIAIAGDPEAAIKLRQVELDAQTKIEEIRAHLAETEIAASSSDVNAVNATMQVEDSKASGPLGWMAFTWRPFLGYISGIMLLGDFFILPLVHITAPEIPPNAWLFLGGVLGIASWGHSQALKDPSNTAVTRG